jgi:hypothetical protein
MVAGAAFALSACGPSGGEIRDIRTQAAQAVSAGEASSEINYVLDDAEFTGPDSAASGWVRFSITNQGQNQNHLAVLRLWEGKTIADLVAHLQQQTTSELPSWATPEGGPADIEPGASANATLNLEAGSYALVRYVADANSVTRVAPAPIHPLTVALGTSVGIEPVPSVLFNITGQGYVANPMAKATRMLASPIKQGSHIVKVTNTGTMVQEVKIIEIEKGKDQDSDPLWEMGRGGSGAELGFRAVSGGRTDIKLQPAIGEDGIGPTSPPPGAAVGGLMPIWPGKTAYINMDFTEGVYVLYSSLPAPDSDQPYFLVGFEIDHFEVWR